MRLARGAAAWALALLPWAPFTVGCLNVDTPSTNVSFDNRYPAAAARPLVVYEAHWQAITLDASTPILPGESVEASTVPASANTAYVVLAPGWNPDAGAPPTAFVVLESKSGFAVHLGDTLHIPVGDTAFTGNCAAGSFLAQPEADFVTQIVFPDTFGGLRYAAATCTTTPVGDGGHE